VRCSGATKQLEDQQVKKTVSQGKRRVENDFSPLEHEWKSTAAFKPGSRGKRFLEAIKTSDEHQVRWIDWRSGGLVLVPVRGEVQVIQQRRYSPGCRHRLEVVRRAWWRVSTSQAEILPSSETTPAEAGTFGFVIALLPHCHAAILA